MRPSRNCWKRWNSNFVAGENLFTEKSRSLEVWACPGDVTPLMKSPLHSGNRTSGNPTTAEPGEHLNLQADGSLNHWNSSRRFKPLEVFLHFCHSRKIPEMIKIWRRNGQKHRTNINIHTVQTSRQQDNAEPDVTWWIRGCGSAASGGSNSHVLPAFLPAASQRKNSSTAEPWAADSSLKQSSTESPPRCVTPPLDQESALTPAAPQSSGRRSRTGEKKTSWVWSCSREKTTTCLQTLISNGKTESIQHVSVWDAECSLLWQESTESHLEGRTQSWNFSPLFINFSNINFQVFHRCSLKLRSELWLGHAATWIWSDLNHLFAGLAEFSAEPPEAQFLSRTVWNRWVLMIPRTREVDGSGPERRPNGSGSNWFCSWVWSGSKWFCYINHIIIATCSQFSLIILTCWIFYIHII